VAHSQRQKSYLRFASPSLLLLASQEVLASHSLSSLGALQALLYFAIGIFVFVWLVAGIILYLVTKRRRAATGRPYFLTNAAIPSGLRVLVIVQGVLAFIVGNVGFLRALFRNQFQFIQVDQDWAVYDIVFCLIFSVLAIVSAIGYINGSPKLGFKLGIVLGWYSVLNAGLYLFAHGWYPGIEPLAVAFGVPLLAFLNWRYRPYFGVEQRSRVYSNLASVCRWTGILIGSLAFIYFGGSLLTTTVFPATEEEARATVSGVADAMQEYRDRHGRWPTDLDQLDSSVDLTYRWNKVEYRSAENELWLRVSIPLEDPDMAYRLTYGFQGRTDTIGSVGHRLK
jgi:hypothetical protein